MPLQYSSVRAEQESVRTSAGLFDVSHMGRYAVHGPGTPEFLQSAVTNDLSRLGPDRAQYNLMCRSDGGIVDDLVVYRAGDSWSVVVNAGRREHDLAWLRSLAPAGVDIVDRSEDVSLLALQGPRAQAVLVAASALGDDDLDAIPYFGIGRGDVAGVPTMISRTGYTGEDGFELFTPSSEVGGVWAELLARGAQPCGLAARDVCRLEAGLRLYGTDMDERVNPYEAGLGWTVKLSKGEFTGRQALQRLREEGPVRQLAGLAGADRAIPRPGSAVRCEGRPVGTVTSGTYSFWLQKGIGMASLEAGAAPVGSRVTMELKSGPGEAEVVTMPFYRGSARRASG
jgi:aminomethyltransferase